MTVIQAASWPFGGTTGRGWLLYFLAVQRVSPPRSGHEPHAAADAQGPRSVGYGLAARCSHVGEAARSPDPPQKGRSHRALVVGRRGDRCPVARTSRTPTRQTRVQPWRSQRPGVGTSLFPPAEGRRPYWIQSLKIWPHPYQDDHEGLPTSTNRPWAAADRRLGSGVDRWCPCLLVAAAVSAACGLSGAADSPVKAQAQFGPAGEGPSLSMTSRISISSAS